MGAEERGTAQGENQKKFKNQKNMAGMVTVALLVASGAPPGPPDNPYTPGCNHKGCSTVPHLLPEWAPTYTMNQ